MQRLADWKRGSATGSVVAVREGQLRLDEAADRVTDEVERVSSSPFATLGRVAAAGCVSPPP